MNIKKLGHCCLLITVNDLRILTDPGTYSTLQDEEKGINMILITHEHADHFHVDSLKRVLANNPEARVITNGSVGKLLEAEGISYTIVTDGVRDESHGVVIEGVGSLHAEIHPDFPRVENTGYFIADELFYPGDALTNPNRQVHILALPVAGPWMKISEAINYARAVNPKKVFPVHDGILKNPGMMSGAFTKLLPEGTEFVPMLEGDEKEF